MRALVALLILLAGCATTPDVVVHERASRARATLHGFGAASASVYTAASMACQFAPELTAELDAACDDLAPAYEQLRATLTAGLALVDEFEAGAVALADLDAGIFEIAEKVALLQVRWREVADELREAGQRNLGRVGSDAVEQDGGCPEQAVQQDAAAPADD